MNSDTNKKPVLAALFVDFDNIFISLGEQNKHIANQFAANPDRWLNWLERSNGRNFGRRILVRRCYMNPQSFSDFRPYFIRSAFEVVDCPPLTVRGKTSTDIHLVMDVLDALNHPSNFEEFIIFSGDTDFTPVLLRLRMHNRLTSILSAGYSISPAYKSACDNLINQDDFIRDGLGINLLEEEPSISLPVATKAQQPIMDELANRIFKEAIMPQGVEGSELPKIFKEFPEFRKGNRWFGFQSLRMLSAAIVTARPDLLMIVGDDPWYIRRKTTDIDIKTDQDLKKAIAGWVKNIVAESPTPVGMASLAGGVTQHFGESIRNSDWLGAGNFKDLLKELDLGNLKILTTIPGYVYDPDRHNGQTPSQPMEESGAANLIMPPAGVFSLKFPELAPLAWKINQLTDIPYLLPEHYTIILKEIAREINENKSYEWTRTSKTVRDRCVEKGVPVARSHVNFILTGLYYSGYPLGKELPVVVASLADKFIENTITLCRNAQFQLSETDIAIVRKWLGAIG